MGGTITPLKSPAGIEQLEALSAQLVLGMQGSTAEAAIAAKKQATASAPRSARSTRKARLLPSKQRVIVEVGVPEYAMSNRDFWARSFRYTPTTDD